MNGLFLLSNKVTVGESAKELLSAATDEPVIGDTTLAVGETVCARRLFLHDVYDGRLVDASGEQARVLRAGSRAFKEALKRLNWDAPPPSRIVFWRNPVVVAYATLPGRRAPLFYVKGEVEKLEVKHGNEEEE